MQIKTTSRYYTPETEKKDQLNSVEEHVKQLELSCSAGGSVD